MKKLRKVTGRIVLAASIVVVLLQPGIANAASLSAGSLALTSNRTAAAGVTYTFTWSNVTTSTIRCIRVSFNTQADGLGTEPTGMDSSSALLDGTSTYVPTPASWGVAAASGVVDITLAGGETPAGASGRTVVLTGITNPSLTNTTFYAIFSTYSNVNCTAGGVDNGNVTFSVTAGQLNTASVGISDPRPLASGVTYTFTASGIGLTSVACIRQQFSTTASGSTVPPDMSTTGATLSGSSTFMPTPASWTADGTTNGTVDTTFAAGEVPGGASGRTVVLTGITNGSVQEVGYYMRFSTYSDVGCTTGPIDQVTVMFIYENGQLVSVDVDPSLTFTVVQNPGPGNCNGVPITQITPWASNNLVDLGRPTIVSNTVGAQNLTISTNALNGFTVYGRYDHALYNQNAPTPSFVTIADASGTNAAPQSSMAAGTEAFGYTTDDATLGTGSANRFTTGGGDKWSRFTTSNLEVAYNGAPAGNVTDIGGGNNNTICLGYQVGINGVTEAGHYTATVFLTATPVY